MSQIRREYLIRGLVQGVGFRPSAARIAEELSLKGSVRNAGGSVRLLLQGEEEAVDELIRRLFTLEGASITAVELLGEDENLDSEWKGFSILASEDEAGGTTYVSPDLATCDSCQREFVNADDRRFLHPFISCVHCGPRYTIIDRIPYDRKHTTMDSFEMCPACREEYTAFGDRRRHAQTIACHDCGPRLLAVRSIAGQDAQVNWSIPGAERDASVKEDIPGAELDTPVKSESAMDHWGAVSEGREAFLEAVSVLAEGGIAAVKDIGGYHLAFRADCAGAAKRLRAFKHRSEKPFAVMFSDIEDIRQIAFLSATEEKLLLSTERPIVLLRPHTDIGGTIAAEVCGDSPKLGAMLPCNPLQMMLVSELGPLVMTSANFGGEPMIYEDEPMFRRMKQCGIPDLILYHDRKILRGLDDSIYQVTEIKDAEWVQVLRRARGLVPLPVSMGRQLSVDSFAAGGDVKAVFGLGRGEVVYLSGYFGDLGNADAEVAREAAIGDMAELLGIKPNVFACDRHPGYISSVNCPSPRREVQHHHAHVLSVMAEHHLTGPVLGVVFDGTGYGDDGTIWGGEFLLCEGGSYLRAAHLRNVKMIGSDVSARDCDSVAYAWLLAADAEAAETFAKGEKRFALQREALMRNVNTVYSSSVGRLFDAAAAILGLVHENTYEGQAPRRVQALAEDFAAKRSEVINPPRFFIDVFADESGVAVLDPSRLLVGLLERKREGADVGALAFAFHEALAEAAVEVCRRIQGEMEKELAVVLGGGTFANGLLLGMMIPELEETGFHVYMNQQVPCNDGGIALGQLYRLTMEGEIHAGGVIG